MYRNYLAELLKSLELNSEYEEYYLSFENQDIIIILSTLHYALINLFKCMNERLPTKNYTNHFWADPSRELLYTIEKIRKLKDKLKNTEFAFDIEEYNLSIIKKCDEFLCRSGGSTIPENTDEIDLYYKFPIFIKKNTIEIKHSAATSNYNLLPLGEGSYAHTYKYFDVSYDKYFVVKKAKKDLTEKEIVRFKREFQIMKKLRSPYILEVYSYNEEKNSYTMEFMDYTLGDYIKFKNNDIPKHTRKSIGLQLLKACKYLHEKAYLHRDLSPNNILIKLYEDVIVVKISDFGLVKLPDSELTTINTEFKGSFNDPQLQIEGFDNYAVHHEIYALTRLLYFIQTGKTNISKIDDVELKKFVQKGIGGKDERYKSVEELNEAYKNL